MDSSVPLTSRISKFPEPKWLSSWNFDQGSSCTFRASHYLYAGLVPACGQKLPPHGHQWVPSTISTTVPLEISSGGTGSTGVITTELTVLCLPRWASLLKPKEVFEGEPVRWVTWPSARALCCCTDSLPHSLTIQPATAALLHGTVLLPNGRIPYGLLNS